MSLLGRLSNTIGFNKVISCTPGCGSSVPADAAGAVGTLGLSLVVAILQRWGGGRRCRTAPGWKSWLVWEVLGAVLAVGDLSPEIC